MAKIVIYTTDNESVEVDASPEDERFYDDLPFTSSNVLCTRVSPDN